MTGRSRAALGGAAAACVWAAAEPVDRRLFRYDYSDVALLGKWVTRSRSWPVAGLALHAANGAMFGLAFDEARDGEPSRRRGRSRSAWRSPSTSRSFRSRTSSTAPPGPRRARRTPAAHRPRVRAGDGPPRALRDRARPSCGVSTNSVARRPRPRRPPGGGADITARSFAFASTSTSSGRVAVASSACRSHGATKSA